MPKLEPYNSWLTLEARAQRETDPLVRTLVLAVRDHMEHEIRGNLPELMATLTAEPVYHFWNPAGGFELRGYAAIEGFYRNLIASGGNQFQVVVEKVIADHGGVITEGQVKQAQTGKALLAAGRTEVDGKPVREDELFMTCAQLVTVWPNDGHGKLVGEDIYFGQDALSTAVRISRADLPDWYRLPG